MKNKTLIIASIVSFFIFGLLSLAYFSPILSDNSLYQQDTVNYKAGEKEQRDFTTQTGEITYWTNAMFGGMPTYQMGAKFEYDWAKKIEHCFRLLPAPADYFLILFSGSFLLGLVLFRDYKYAFAGAIFFGFSTYFLQATEAGHNSKILAIDYFAPLVASILLLYKRKYIIGFILTTLTMALELSANHPQMTYYLALSLLVYAIVQFFDSVKKDKLKDYITSSSLLIFAIMIAVGMNSTRILSTYEYGNESIRGASKMTILNDGKKTSGLDPKYITKWSYGKLETINLLIPNFMGGNTGETTSEKENLLQAVRDNVSDPKEIEQIAQIIPQIGTYWGTQPFTSGPAYQGAVVVFLFLLGLFFVKGKYKWWLVLSTLLSIALAWGDNFSILTDFFINYLPMYNKFRAVSSILVIAEFTMPLLAAMCLYNFFTEESLTHNYKEKVLIYVGGGFLVSLILLYFMGGSMFNFSEEGLDSQLPKFMRNGIRLDRIQMFQQDTLRTIFFIAATLVLLFVAHYKDFKFKSEIIIFSIAILSLLDVWNINKRYLSNDNFAPKNLIDNPFITQKSERLLDEAENNNSIYALLYKADYNGAMEELKNHDPSQYRVYNGTQFAFTEANTSYFHQSVGGYHGAKLRRYQDIINMYLPTEDIYLKKQKQLGTSGNILPILNLLNTKYVVQGSLQKPEIAVNKEANGNAWFVNKLNFAKDANEEIMALNKMDNKKEAILELSNQEKINLLNQIEPSIDTLSNIQLTNYLPNNLTYKTNSSTNQLAVFSEIYYNKGWKAFIDNKPTPILRADYILRALPIPKGIHTVVFKFDPSVIKVGGIITLTSNLLFLFLFLIGIGYEMRKYLGNRKMYD